MPATGKTPIQFYRSTTSGNQPSAANLSPGELALNIADTDMTMYFENASGVVKRFFNNPAELKYPTADGTSGQGVKTDGSKTLSFGSLASAAITNNTRQAVTSSATTTINLASGQVIDLTMAANITTLSFTNVPASGTPVLVQIVVRNASSGTAYTIAWPNSVYWSGQYSATTINTVQTAPTLASGANGVTTIALLTTDGGTKWRGWVESLIPGGSEGRLYTWANNNVGVLGQNDLTRRSSPVQIGALSNWAMFTFSTSGSTCLAVKTDRTLWSWGDNTNAQLGLNQQGYFTSKSSPTQIGSLTNWAKVSVTAKTCLAVKTDGTLWTWGYGLEGSLGQNDTTNRSSPVQVGALTNWSNVAGARYSCMAIKTDGSIWSWGSNTYGQLGLNATTSQSSPVQIGALTTWSNIGVQLFGGFATKTDGTLWSWGLNASGQLGQNSITNFSSPVQVGALTTWSRVASQTVKSCFAVKSDGTLWVWGQGSDGSLGLNNTNNVSSPTQLGALTNWAQTERFASQAGLVSTSFSTLAVKTDGTLWGMGTNAYGQLGLNTATSQSSPVQIGALTTWTAVTSSIFASGALSSTSVNPA